MTLERLSQDVESMITEEQIRERLAELGKEITETYQGQPLTLIVILKGSFVFAADIARHIDLPLAIDFIGVSSYGDSTKSSGVVRITQDLSKPIEGRHVLVVEDIVDTGLTMEYLLDNLKSRHPTSLKVCSLLEKPSRAIHKIEIDFLGFTIPDAFVVGYGLDFAERYRNLPFIGVLKKEARHD
ncbi:MAG: hypoxanthine phosphoribosyltransferase [Deltaproteobacteria bacterium]|nr:hypoxanthine phosphoribosyltransferase [Deltaproteobacteria bacterium]